MKTGFAALALAALLALSSYAQDTSPMMQQRPGSQLSHFLRLHPAWQHAHSAHTERARRVRLLLPHRAWCHHLALPRARTEETCEAVHPYPDLVRSDQRLCCGERRSIRTHPGCDPDRYLGCWCGFLLPKEEGAQPSELKGKHRTLSSECFCLSSQELQCEKLCTPSKGLGSRSLLLNAD